MHLDDTNLDCDLLVQYGFVIVSTVSDIVAYHSRMLREKYSVKILADILV
jgi:hypothetical protein